MHKTTSGWINGFTGVVIFSGSLPATRLALAGFEPVFLTAMRATIAGAIAATALLVFNEKRPTWRELKSLVIVAAGVVVGFPLLTALALQRINAAHSIVFIGLLPLATAVFGVIRGGERPQRPFWIFSGAGSLVIIAFALGQGFTRAPIGDALMLAAVLVCGLGYAEGATLSRGLGGWQVICWALVLSLPVMTTIAWTFLPSSFTDIGAEAWAGLGYVSLFSMLIGFVFWYRGLADGGIAGVGQLQLLQPFLGLALAAALLGETLTWPMLASAAGIVLCVAGAKQFAR
jgi:drug/metabolite transporter (DMT)-like permease